MCKAKGGLGPWPTVDIVVSCNAQRTDVILTAKDMQDARILVCGSANKMPSQVAATLQASVFESAGGLTKEAAFRLLKDLRSRERYVVEAWS